MPFAASVCRHLLTSASTNANSLDPGRAAHDLGLRCLVKMHPKHFVGRYRVLSDKIFILRPTDMWNASLFVCLFDLILYVPSTIFQL